MLSYNKLKNTPRDFLAATGVTQAEFQQWLPAFQRAYNTLAPSTLTRAGKSRQRRAGGGAQGGLHRFEDKLLFILVYQQTKPLQTMHALPFALSQPQAHSWMHPLLPVLQRALAALGHAPERDASRLATSPLLLASAPAGVIDGTERRRPRPTAAQRHKEHSRGKNKTHTDKNILVVHEMTGQVVYRAPTVAGKTHAKRAADAAPIASPTNATLGQETGWQGYEPDRGLTTQPKKSPKAKNEALVIAS